MADERVFIHRLDAEGRITSVNEPWLRFAAENGARGLDEGSVVGRTLRDFVADRTTAHLLGLIVHRVRMTSRHTFLPYRCDSPDRRRWMVAEVGPTRDGGVEFRNRIHREESRAPVALLDPGVRRCGEVLTLCGWCKKVRLFPLDWVEAEDAVIARGLIDQETFPPLSHGLCPGCNEYLRRSAGLVRRVPLSPVAI